MIDRSNTKFVEQSIRELEVSFQRILDDSERRESVDAHPCDLKPVTAWAGIVVDLLDFVPCHVLNFDFIV